VEPPPTRIARHALADGRGGITARITARYVPGILAMGRGSVPGGARKSPPGPPPSGASAKNS
jgi:hypothetical protein